MALIITVNGASKGIQALNISASQNNQDRLSGTFVSVDGSESIDIDDVIIATEDADRIFGGSVKTPTLGGFADGGASIATQFSASDFNELASRQTVTLTIPAGTLKAAATALLPYLPGVTLDAGQLDGPAMPELVYEDTYVAAILDELTTRSGWLRNIDYYKVLKFFEAGTVSAPWHVSDADGNVVGDVKVAKTRIDYANRVIVKFTEAARTAYAFLGKTGGNFADGDTVKLGGTTYTFKTVLIDTAGFVLIGADSNGSLANLVAAITLGGGSGSVYAASTTVNASATAYMQHPDRLAAVALTSGASGNSIASEKTATGALWYGEGNVPTDTLTRGSDEALTNRAQQDDLAEQALYGVYTGTFEAASVYSYASAVELAAAILVFSVVVQQTVTYDTYRAGLFPGMTQNIQRTNRGVNAACLITDVNHRWLEKSILLRSVTAVVGNIYKGSRWRDQYKKWSGSASSSATPVSSGGGGGTTVISRPVYFLGGSPESWVQSPTPTWVPAAGSTEGGIEYVIDTTARGSLIATVRVRLRAMSGGVTARLWDIDNGVQCGISTKVTNTSYESRTFSVVLSSGAFRYRLELLPDTANEDVNGVGYLE